MSIQNQVVLERSPMEKKRISVSEKRQITIPKQFYETLGISNEVECFVHNGTIVIRPVKDNDDFSFEILRDITEENPHISGKELLQAFEHRKQLLRNAVNRLIDEADQAARNYDGRDETAELFEEE